MDPESQIFHALTAESASLPADRPPLDIEAIAAEYTRNAVNAAIAERFERSCPPAYRTAATRWDDGKLAANQQAIAAVRGWQHGPTGILASGPTQRGKTRAMFALYERLATVEHIDVRYYHAHDWFDALGRHCEYGRDDARGWVEAVARQPIVFIDDYGQEALQRSRTDWARSWWFRFLDLRVAAQLPLLITTNLSASDMTDQNGGWRGDPLIRRILDLCEVVKFT